MFISRSSLWTDIGGDPKKAKVYLKRSNSSPINLLLCGDNRPPLDDPFPGDPSLRIISQAIGRLKSLTTSGTPGYIQDVTTHIFHPAPLLEYLSMTSRHGEGPHRDPLLISTHFDGDLSSLRTLRLECVRTELPWRNMVNLTSLRLVRTSPVSVRRTLDFFENAPHLREVELWSVTQIPSAENGRLVSLACLKRMDITGGGSSSPLLDHVLIPAGACLTASVDLPAPSITHRTSRFLDDLKNLPGFTTIQLYGDEAYPRMKFGGPGGEVTLIVITPHDNEACFILESLAHFDTSKTERLTIDINDTSSRDLLHQTLLPMKDLRTLTLAFCVTPHILIHALHPIMSLSTVVLCPNLEELVINHWQKPDLKDVIGMAAARESRGAGLKLVRTVSQVKSIDVLKLKNYVLRVECGPDAGVDDDSDSSGED